MRQRGEATKATRSRFVPPGLGYALCRDIGYTTATQKQVQNAADGTNTGFQEVALNIMGITLMPLVLDTLSVKAVSPTFRLPRAPFELACAACPPQALIGRALWVPL